MSLKPGEDIPSETHSHIDQFFRVESGEAFVKINSDEFVVKEDEVFIVPAGARHYVKNSGKTDLKLYTIYAPSEHPEGIIHKTKADADKSEH